ncbi:LysR substrate-binding domain-containing protein [Thalassotalea fusca]
MANDNGISLEALIVLDAIEHRGSFAAAAEELNKVPSALSYIIQKLEEQLGISVFIRQGRRSVLTPAGRHLLNEGRKVLNAVEQIGNQTQTIANGWEPKINIAIDSIVDISQIFEKLSIFLNEYPSIELHLHEEVMKGTWEALVDDRVDLVIGAPAPAPNHQGLSIRHFDKIDNTLVAAPSHQLTKSNKAITAELLKQYRTIVVRDSVRFDVARSANVIEQSSHLYVQSVEQKIKAIMANLGIGFLPRSRIEHELTTGKLVELPNNMPVINNELLIAWKTVNRGKGLEKLRQILLE